MSTEAILLVAATLNLALIIGLSVSTALLKARRERRARRHEEELALLRPVMMRYLATWEDGDAHDLADMLIGYRGVTTSFEELVAGLLPKLRGPTAACWSTSCVGGAPSRRPARARSPACRCTATARWNCWARPG